MICFADHSSTAGVAAPKDSPPRILQQIGSCECVDERVCPGCGSSGSSRVGHRESLALLAAAGRERSSNRRQIRSVSYRVTVVILFVSVLCCAVLLSESSLEGGAPQQHSTAPRVRCHGSVGFRGEVREESAMLHGSRGSTLHLVVGSPAVDAGIGGHVTRRCNSSINERPPLSANTTTHHELH